MLPKKNCKIVAKGIRRSLTKLFIASLRKAKSSDPKPYWKMLQGSKDYYMYVSLQDFYEHSKQLSLNNTDYKESYVDPDIEQDSFDTKCLNAPFTEGEM